MKCKIQYVTCLLYLQSLLFAQDIIQNGFTKSLGMGMGYYQYAEFDTLDNPVMRMDTGVLRILGDIGYIYNNGIKLYGSLDANMSIGVYTGSILDPTNPDRDGQKLTALVANSFYDARFKVAYNILKPFNIANMTLYLQVGTGYYFNYTNGLSVVRFQGYTYIPIELESEIRINEKIVINYGIGYDYFLVGNHFTKSTQWYYGDNYQTIQKQGFGVSALFGVTFIRENGQANSVKLAYQYWDIGAGEPMRTTEGGSGVTTPVVIYEPKNHTHLIMLQYTWHF